MKSLFGKHTLLALACSCFSLGSVMADEIDNLDREYTKLAGEHKFATAEHLCLRMVEVSPTSSWKAASLNRLGIMCKNQGRYDDAEKYYLAAFKENIPANHVNLGWIPGNLAWLYLDQGRFDEAEHWANLARTNLEASRRTPSTQMAGVLTNLGRIYYAKKQLPLAAQYHNAALTMRQTILGAENEEVSYNLSDLGRILAEQGKLDEAEAMLSKALAMQDKLLSKGDFDTAWTKSYFAFIHRQRGNFAKAEELDRLVLKTLETSSGLGDRRLPEAYENLAADLEKQDKLDESKELLARATETRAKRAERWKDRTSKEVDFAVEVASPQANIKFGTTVLLTAKKGDRFQANHIDGPWYGVAVNSGDERKAGYLHARDIVIPSEVGFQHQIRWQDVSPSAGKFTVSLPGSPKLTKQVVNGIDNIAYEASASNAVFLVSYFDIPGGSALTFDAAMGAYTAARKAQLLSQKAIDIDLNPGREFAAKLPNGETSRMQLIQVGRRWYTMTVEGNAEVAYGDHANKFFESFRVKD